MIFGPVIRQALPKVRVLCLFGQSNAVGRHDGSRIANTAYNYNGIANGYPSARTTQAQYTATPDDVLIYYKDLFFYDDQSVDNGSWVSYQAGVNSAPKTVTSILLWGSELSCATQLQEATGDVVAIIKAAWNSTGLSRSLTNSQAPGNWNNASRTAAVEYYLKRGIRDLKTLYPNHRIEVNAVNWWQGENDGSGNIPNADYQRQFLEFKSYVDNAIAGLVVQEAGRKHIWNMTLLDFNRSAGEGIINDAAIALAAAHDDIYTVNAAGYPQSDELSSAEAAPVAVGAPNANGWNDDNHSSYIGQLAMGELQFANIQTAGLI